MHITANAPPPFHLLFTCIYFIESNEEAGSIHNLAVLVLAAILCMGYLITLLRLTVTGFLRTYLPGDLLNSLATPSALSQIIPKDVTGHSY